VLRQNVSFFAFGFGLWAFGFGLLVFEVHTDAELDQVEKGLTARESER
jgi:hypothetical protein